MKTGFMLVPREHDVGARKPRCDLNGVSQPPRRMMTKRDRDRVRVLTDRRQLEQACDEPAALLPIGVIGISNPGRVDAVDLEPPTAKFKDLRRRYGCFSAD